MVFIGQSVDHRDARVRRQTLDDALLEGTDHDQVTHARNHLRRVLDRLTATQLRITRIEVDRRTTQLLHAGFEGKTRARAGLLENHHQRTVAQRPVALKGLELLLDPARALEQIVVLLAREILELKIMFNA